MIRLVEVSYLVILCLEWCRCDWKSTHSVSEQFNCREPQRRSYRITELLNLSCNDDTVPAHVVLNRCDDMSGTCTNQKAVCTPTASHTLTFQYQWKQFGTNEYEEKTASVSDDISCGCNDTIIYQCT